MKLRAGKHTFKGVRIETGDIIAFEARSVPLPHVEAAFLTVTDAGELDVFSTLLAPFQHSGLFKEDEVGKFMLVRKAVSAIPRQSGGKGFFKNSRVRTTIDGKVQEGTLVAAFNGILCAIQDDGETLNGGSAYFQLAA